MPIETKCPGCQRLLRVPDEHAGKRARCPACNTIYVVPGGAAAPETPVVEMGDLWHMKTPEGQVYGPVSKSELDRWLSEGRISAECLLRSENEPDWRPADEYYGVLSPQPRGPLGAASVQAAPAGPAPVAPAAPTTPAWRAESPSVPHRGGMILIFGILGWVFGCPVFSVMAWVMGSSDLREMRAGRMDRRGMGLTQAGHILGLIYTLLWIVVFVIALFVFMVAAVV